MARSIDSYLNTISTSIYGKDIKTAIYNALAKIYDELSPTQTLIFNKIKTDYSLGKCSASDVWAYKDAGVITNAQAEEITAVSS